MTRYSSAILFSSRAFSSHAMVSFLTLAVVVAALAVSSQANATPIPVGATAIVDADGFESTATPSYDKAFAPPGLPVGSLEGQSGRLPGDMTTAKWVASIGTTSTAVVQDTTFLSSDQAIRVDRAANEPAGGGQWTVPVIAWPDGARHVCIEWDMMVEDTAGPNGAFGPLFGVFSYDDDGVGASNGQTGSMTVDATTGEVLYQETGTGNLVPTSETVVFGEWNHFHLDLDYLEHEYSVILNGDVLWTEPFIDGASLDQFTDADIVAAPGAGDLTSLGLTGTAYIDNYVVYQLDVKIPEPSSCILALLALLALSRARLQRG